MKSLTFREIIAIQIKYNPYSYSCPHFCCYWLQESERERERDFYLFILTARKTLHQGIAVTRDFYFIRLLDPGKKQWLLIGWRNGHELLGCSLFWDHTREGTFYLMKSGSVTPFRLTMCVCVPNLAMLWGQICRKCPQNVVKSDKTHFGDVLKGKRGG